MCDVNKANLLVWKNIQVKKRTREISKVFHSYHPYDHKVGIAHCLFVSVRVFSSFQLSLQPRSQDLSGGAGRETLGRRLPSRFFPACCLLSNQCVILLPFQILKVGELQTVLITEDAKDQAHFVGHNKFYDQVSHDLLVVFVPSFPSCMWMSIVQFDR